MGMFRLALRLTLTKVLYILLDRVQVGLTQHDQEAFFGDQVQKQQRQSIPYDVLHPNDGGICLVLHMHAWRQQASDWMGFAVEIRR